MKKLNKNILITLGTTSSILAPIASVVACDNSSSNNVVKPSNNVVKPSNNVVKPSDSISSSNVIRTTTEILNSAYNQHTHTLDLTKIYNHAELSLALAEISTLNKMKGLKCENKTLEDWNKAKDLLEQVSKTDQIINLTDGKESVQINFELSKIFPGLINELTNKDILSTKSAEELQRTGAFASQTSWNIASAGLAAGHYKLLDMSGQHPENSSIAVQALIRLDSTFALDILTKLTNLPDAVFAKIADLIHQFDAIFASFDSSHLYTVWSQSKQSDYSSSLGLPSSHLFRGEFLINILEVPKS